MNERIRQLAEQATTVTEQDDIDYRHETFDKAKFAELIVEECLGIVNRHEYSYHEADPLWETAQLIKEHFGMSDESVAPKVPAGYTAEELDRDNPYNQWMGV